MSGEFFELQLGVSRKVFPNLKVELFFFTKGGGGGKISSV